MTRARNVVPRLRRRRRIQRRARGFWGARNHLIKMMKETLVRAGAFAYRDRRNKKRNFRSLWIQRINAAARSNELTYSKLVHGLKTAGVELDRKALADMAFHDPDGFAAVAEKAKQALAA